MLPCSPQLEGCAAWTDLGDVARTEPNSPTHAFHVVIRRTDGLVSGIRGRVGAGLTPEVVATYAAGFGAWATGLKPGRPIVVGRDSRVSGPLFHRVVLSALESVGCRRDRHRRRADPDRPAGGRASSRRRRPGDHGEPQSGGVERAQVHRVVGPVPRTQADEPEMRALRSSEGFHARTWDKLGHTRDRRPRRCSGTSTRSSPCRILDVAGIRAREVPGGARLRATAPAADHASRCSSALGCEVTAIQPGADGRFPSPARADRREPWRARSVGSAERRGDRLRHGSGCGPVGARRWSTAHAIGEDYTLAFATALVLRKTPGAVVTNLSTSRVVEDAAIAAGPALCPGAGG